MHKMFVPSGKTDNNDRVAFLILPCSMKPKTSSARKQTVQLLQGFPPLVPLMYIKSLLCTDDRVCV